MIDDIPHFQALAVVFGSLALFVVYVAWPEIEDWWRRLCR